nr:uncharacterized protein LOC104104521 [Nicotiana tomentosiformis]
MADRTMKRLLGIIEDVMIRVDEFILPEDFIILDCEVDYEVPIILGRHFLAMGKAFCYVEAGVLTFRCKLLEKDAKFHFNDDCMRAFELLKLKLTTTPIITAPNWSLPFELMCDASDVAVGAVLRPRINKVFHPFSYASKTMNSHQFSYTVTEKELLAIEEFDIDIQDRRDLANILVSGMITDEFSSNERKKLKRDCKCYFWDEPKLFQICSDRVIRRCVTQEEQGDILGAFHSSPYGGHYGRARTAAKVLSCGLYWPTLYKDASDLVKR